MAVSPSIALTPQAQIIVENNTLEDTSDDYGDVDFGNGFAARGRLGVALNTTLGQPGAAAATDLMLRASVWQLEAWEAAVLPLNYARHRTKISGAGGGVGTVWRWRRCGASYALRHQDICVARHHSPQLVGL